MRPSVALSSSSGVSFAGQTHRFKAQYIGCQTTGKSSMVIGTKKVCNWLEFSEWLRSFCALSTLSHLELVEQDLLQITGIAA